MATWDKDLGRTFVHTNDALCDLEDFQTCHVDLWNHFNTRSLYLIKRLCVWARNQDNIVRSDFVKIAILSYVFGKLAIKIIVVDIRIDLAFAICETEKLDSQLAFLLNTL